jgi:hypothetical protein
MATAARAGTLRIPDSFRVGLARLGLTRLGLARLGLTRSG